MALLLRIAVLAAILAPSILFCVFAWRWLATGKTEVPSMGNQALRLTAYSVATFLGALLLIWLIRRMNITSNSGWLVTTSMILGNALYLLLVVTFIATIGGFAAFVWLRAKGR